MITNTTMKHGCSYHVTSVICFDFQFVVNLIGQKNKNNQCTHSSKSVDSLNKDVEKPSFSHIHNIQKTYFKHSQTYKRSSTDVFHTFIRHKRRLLNIHNIQKKFKRRLLNIHHTKDVVRKFIT